MNRLLLAALTACLTAVPAAAEPIRFTYYDSFGFGPPGEGLPDGLGYSFVRLTVDENAEVEPGVPAVFSRGGTRRGAAPVGSVSFDAPAHFWLRVDDAPSGRTGLFHVVGRLAGEVTGADGSTLRFTFPDAPADLWLGANRYQVRVGSVAVPPWGDPAGQVVDIPWQVTVTQIPEPGTLTLAALGVAGWRLVRRRKPSV